MFVNIFWFTFVIVVIIISLTHGHNLTERKVQSPTNVIVYFCMCVEREQGHLFYIYPYRYVEKRQGNLIIENSFSHLF